MVIKIDIGDNDFAGRIEEILDRKVNGLIMIWDDYFYDKLEKLGDDGSEAALKEYFRISNLRDDIRKYFWDDEDSEMTKKEVEREIYNSVLYLIENSFSNDDIEYLKETITIKIQKTMKAEWENGEVIYYFPTTYSTNRFLLF